MGVWLRQVLRQWPMANGTVGHWTQVRDEILITDSTRRQEDDSYLWLLVDLFFSHFVHGHTARVCHGLPKVSLGPVMPDPFMPCRQARRAGSLQPSSTPSDAPRCTPMVIVVDNFLASFHSSWFNLLNRGFGQRHMARGFQEGRKQLQVTCLAGGPPLKQSYGRFRGGARHRMAGHGGPYSDT
jgi:hypothetical protein